MSLEPLVLAPPLLRVSALWGDNAVLQAGKWLPLRGKEIPGGCVRVVFDGVEVGNVITNSAGVWTVRIPPHPAGGPHRLEVSGASGEFVSGNLVFGELWVAAGQSNMEFPMKNTLLSEQLGGKRSDVRFFRMPKRVGAAAMDFLSDGVWQIADSDSFAEFSAVAGFFADRLHEVLCAPVGIVQSAWGGTGIQAWTPTSEPSDALTKTTSGSTFSFSVSLSELIDDIGVQETELRRWEAYRDIAYNEVDQDLASGSFADETWTSCPVPGTFEEVLGDFDGEVWFRRTVEIPAHWQGRSLTLHLGVIDDLDHCFFDGVLIGKTAPSTPEYFKQRREYTIPSALVKGGTRTLAVRVFDEYMSGGFVSSASDLWLAPEDAASGERLMLSGLWKIRAGRPIAPRPMMAGMPQMLPGVLYNSMISPLVSHPIAGFLWYQGENDCGNADFYRLAFCNLIHEWRARWEGGLLPFLFVQLAGFGESVEKPVCSALADLREAQAAALELPATGMVTAADLGEVDDLHPKRKKEIGQRLANLALRDVYRRSVPEAGRLLAGAIEPSENGWQISVHSDLPVRLSEGACVPLDVIRRDGSRTTRDGLWQEGKLLLPSGPHDSDLAEIRYGWASNPRLSIYDRLGTPLAPFRRSFEKQGRERPCDSGAEVRLVVRADDAGLTVGTNRAIAQLCGLGVVRSVGILVVAPEFQDAVARFKNMPGIHLGLHFALTCEWDRPLWGSASSPDDVPHLADERGMLPRSTHELLDRSVPVSEMVHELETQYARLVAAGIQPHYIDDHMGCSWIPGLASAIETFAREKGVVFFQDSIAGVPGGKDSSVAPKFSVASLRERMDQAEPGTYLLVIHPASKDEAFVKLKLADCHPSNLFERELEFLGFRSPAVFHQLTENEVRLISYPEAATQC